MEIKTLIDRLNPRGLFALAFAYLLTLCILSYPKPIGDFGNYYFGSFFLAKGNFGSWVYEPYLFNLKIYALGYRDFFLNYTPVPPFSALFYLPVAYLDAAPAKLLWNILGSALFILALYRISVHYKIKPWLLALPVFIFYLPVQSNIQQGQSYFLIFYLLAEGVIQYDSKRYWPGCLLWVLAAHLKIFPLILIVPLLLDRNWKALGWYALWLTLIAILCFSLFPIVCSEYVSYILPRLAKGEINNTYSFTYQSVQVFLKNIFVPDTMHNPHAPFHHEVAYHILLRLYQGCVFMLALLWHRQLSHAFQKIAIWMLAAMMMSGYGQTYGLLLFIFPLLALFMDKPEKPWLPLLLLAILVNIPVWKLASLSFPLQYLRLYLSFGFLLLCIYRFKIAFHRTAIPALVCVLIALLLPADKKDTSSSYLLQKEEALLIYDFRLRGDSAELDYFDQMGPGRKVIALPFHINDADLGRVSAGKRDGNQGILKEIGLQEPQSDRTLYMSIFLTDKERGPGFYTLRISPPLPNGD